MMDTAGRGVGSDQLRGERTMVRVRWVAAVWALVQIQLYEALPYPPGVRTAAYGLVGLLVAGNLGLWLAARRVGASDVRAGRRLAAAGLCFEVAVASAFVWLWAFDSASALWVVLFLVPVAAAARFALPGAISAWIAVAGLYVGREVWAASRYGFELSVASVTFRCGMLGLVALVVGWLTRDLVAQRERARQLEQWRGRLTSMLAHDIRSPLAAVDMALAGLDRIRDEEDRQALVDVARRQTVRVLHLAHDLLDLAASEQGRLTLHRTPTPLVDIIERALVYADPRGQVTVELDDGLVVDVDPDRIEQVVVNLIANATNHGRPPVDISAGRQPEGTVLLRVRDHGDGVAPELRPSLFQPFARADNSANRHSVGLGLWVAAQLISAHGGQLDYQPGRDGGAEFTATLPTPPATNIRDAGDVFPIGAQAPVGRHVEEAARSGTGAASKVGPHPVRPVSPMHGRDLR